MHYPNPRMPRTSARRTQARASMSRSALNRSQQSDDWASIQRHKPERSDDLSNTGFGVTDSRCDDFDESDAHVRESPIRGMSAEMWT